MAGYKVVKVGTDEDGGVDLDDLRAKADEDVACLMLTNPNTLGLFDKNIEEIAKIVHGEGATLYYDGANLNAVMGHRGPGDMGFDIVHLNLHKSFTQPHGGGGPGRGADRGVRPHRALPAAAPGAPPPATHNGPRSGLRPRLPDRPQSIGRPRGFQGTSGSSCAPTPTSGWGATAWRDVPRDRRPERQLPQGAAGGGRHRRVPAGRLRPPLHARVRALRAPGQAGARGANARPRQADARLPVHPPTVYFPLLVDEAMLLEPTETETRERIDDFVDVVREILAEARGRPRDRPQGRALHHPRASPRRGRARPSAPWCARGAAAGRRAAGRPGARRAGDGAGRGCLLLLRQGSADQHRRLAVTEDEELAEAACPES